MITTNCQECGKILKNVHGNTKYCKECKKLITQDQSRNTTRTYRQKWNWNNKNPKGSRNCNLGSKALEDKMEEQEIVNKERTTLLGNAKYIYNDLHVTPVIDTNESNHQEGVV